MDTTVIDVKYKNRLISYRVRKNTYDEEIANAILREYSRVFDLDIDGLPIVDIGGHIGSFAKAASITYPHSNVHSFEPDPESYSLLEENLCGLSNCFAHNSAISGVELRGRLVRKGEPSWNMTVWDKSEGIEVDCVPINSFFDQFNKIGILKIDCEGSELSFLPHLSEENKSKIMFVTGESHAYEKDTHNFKSQHNDGNMFRKIFPKFKMIVENRMFFGWSVPFSFVKEKNE